MKKGIRIIFVGVLLSFSIGRWSSQESLASVAPVQYPTQAIRVIVPYGAGSNSDLNARIIADIIQQENLLPQALIIANIPGGNTNEACDTLRASNPDGYTIMFHQSSMLSMANLGTLGTNYYDMVPIIEVGYQPTALIAKKDAPFNTIEEMLHYARQHPNVLNWGYSGVGSSTNLGSEAFWRGTNSKDLFTTITFQSGAETIAALLGGHCDIGMMTASEAAAYINSGDYKGLAFSGNERLPAYPDIPCYAELGGGETFVVRQGFFAPKRTPQEILEILSDAFVKATQFPRYNEYCKTYSITPSAVSLSEWDKILEQQNAEIAELVKAIKK
jgi:tripartite-type tricarboxylate transporter receptor subunit TctC